MRLTKQQLDNYIRLGFKTVGEIKKYRDSWDEL